MNNCLHLPWITRPIKGLVRWLQPPQNLNELARRVEPELPGLAAELRIVALHRREAPE